MPRAQQDVPAAREVGYYARSPLRSFPVHSPAEGWLLRCEWDSQQRAATRVLGQRQITWIDYMCRGDTGTRRTLRGVGRRREEEGRYRWRRGGGRGTGAHTLARTLKSSTEKKARQCGCGGEGKGGGRWPPEAARRKVKAKPRGGVCSGRGVSWRAWRSHRLRSAARREERTNSGKHTPRREHYNMRKQTTTNTQTRDPGCCPRPRVNTLRRALQSRVPGASTRT